MSEDATKPTKIIDPIPPEESGQALGPNFPEYLEPQHKPASDGAVQVRTEFLERHHSGPLPSPETLVEYERILPGAAERIFSRFEKQSDHRMSMESKVVSSNAWSQRAATVGSLVFGITALAGSIFLVHEGRDLGGLTLFIGTVGSVAGTFVYGKHVQQKEREDARNPEAKNIDVSQSEQHEPQ